VQTGPIRPFTPYQRKRKSQQGDASKSKLERLTSKDSTTDESSDVATPVTPCGITPSMNPLTQALMKISQTSPPTTEEAWRNLEDVRVVLFSFTQLPSLELWILCDLFFEFDLDGR